MGCFAFSFHFKNRFQNTVNEFGKSEHNYLQIKHLPFMFALTAQPAKGDKHNQQPFCDDQTHGRQ